MNHESRILQELHLNNPVTDSLRNLWLRRGIFSEFVDLNRVRCSSDKRRCKRAVAGKSDSAGSRSLRRHAECNRIAESGN